LIIIGVFQRPSLMLKNNEIKIFGHRGAAGLAFENTLPGIQRALDEGVDGIEIDVWKTTDNELVVFHDAYLDRLTEKSGLIADFSSSELRVIKLKSGDHIPTLVEVIQMIEKSGVQLLVEVKHEEAFDLTVNELKKSLDVSRYTVGSFYHKGIKHLKETNPNINTAIMFECVPILFEDYLNKVNPDYIVASIETYNPYLIETVKAQGRKLLFYTVNTPAEIKLAMQAVPYGIISNYPNLFVDKQTREEINNLSSA
jgi:glycerophosphoryl diester phosphodiesterase